MKFLLFLLHLSFVSFILWAKKTSMTTMKKKLVRVGASELGLWQSE